MWIDAEKLRFDDYHPNMFSEDELMSSEEQAEFERMMAQAIPMPDGAPFETC